MNYLSCLDKDKSRSIVGIIAAATLIYSLFHFQTEKKPAKDFKEIPVPSSAYPYIGHLLSLGNKPAKQVKEWHRKYGPIIKLKMGVQDWIFIDDPQIAYEVFVRKGAKSAARPISLFNKHYSFDGRGVVFGEKETWRISREALTTVLAPKAVEKYMDIIDFESTEVVSRLIGQTDIEGSTNPKDIVQVYTMNVICYLTTGERFTTIDDPDYKELKAMIKKAAYLNGAEKDIGCFLPILSFFEYFLNIEKEINDHAVNRNRAMKKRIDKASEREGINIMKTLNDETFNMEEKDKIVLLSDMIIAGQDTTEYVILWTVAILCHHPQAQSKIQAEIDDFIEKNKRLPNFSERDQFPYCVSVMKECMRYRPGLAFGGPRRTTETIEVNGYIIKEGTTVISNIYSMHSKESVYTDAEKFIPERFMKNTKSMYASANGKLSERDHFNFGWGRRICPGAYLAEAEFFFAFIKIFAQSTIEPVTDNSGKASYPNISDSIDDGIITAVAPYHVKFTRRPTLI